MRSPCCRNVLMVSTIGHDSVWLSEISARISLKNRKPRAVMNSGGFVLARGLFLLLTCLTIALAGCQKHSNHPNPDAPSLSKPYDQRFLDWLVNYHHDGDRMITPCAANQTIRTELRAFCSTVDQQHTQQVEQMKTWLHDWYNADLPSTDPYALWLRTLNGTQFEREFLKEYRRHHAEAIEPMIECTKNATHLELRDLCSRTIPRQREDVQQLKKWSCDWFKECD